MQQAADYYTARLEEYGPTYRGVDWNSLESQHLRFDQLLRICGSAAVDVNDYGCGYGALAEYLAASGAQFRYTGYDAAPAMIAAARERSGGDARCRFTADRSAVEPRPFTVASGVLNVKQDAGDAEWWTYVTGVLDDLARLSERGFAFNLLTAYSDDDRRRARLFYASPEEVFRYCAARFSRHVAVLHDYPLYEFTVLVRKDRAWRHS